MYLDDLMYYIVLDLTFRSCVMNACLVLLSYLLIRSESSDIRILCQKYKMETSNLHPCGICGTMAVNLDSLMSHLTEKHPNILHYTCHICNKEFKNYCVLIRLQTHFVTFHSGKPPPSLTEQVEQATTIQDSGYVPIYNIMLKLHIS